jgi:hypothetical protein
MDRTASRVASRKDGPTPVVVYVRPVDDAVRDCALEGEDPPVVMAGVAS